MIVNTPTQNINIIDFLFVVAFDSANKAITGNYYSSYAFGEPINIAGAVRLKITVGYYKEKL